MSVASAQELLASKLAALADSFAQSLPGKLHELQQALGQCQSEARSRDDFVRLNRLLHTLAGSAGTFGFAGLGQAAGRIEGYMHDMLRQEGEQFAGFDAIAVQIGEFLHWASKDPRNAPVQSANTPLAVVHTEISEPIRTSVPVNTHLLYLLDPQPLSSQDMVMQLENFGHEVRIFLDYPTLIEAVGQKMPSALLVDMNIADGGKGLSALHALGRGKMPCVFIGQSARFEARMAAVMANADGYFVKPVDIVALNARIETLVLAREKAPYRILIVDDEVLVTDFYSAILKTAGMDVRTLQQPADIFDVMAEFKPELLLIDMYMPDYSGISLARVIRQESMYLDVPIVFLSAESSLEKQLDAIAAGADDFLTKPMPGPYLISSLTSRVERYRALRDLILRDSLTRLYNHSTMKEQAAVEIERAKRHGKPLALAMIDLDYFKNVNDNYGHLVGDNVIRSLAQLLQKMLRRVDIIGRYGGEEFAVIFPDTHAVQAVLVLDKVRASFAKIKHHSMDHQWYFEVTFSGGVVELRNQADANVLFAQADAAMYAAKHAGRNRILQFE